MYEIPGTDIGLTQGDIFVDCPIVDWIRSTSDTWEPQQYTQKVIVLTQACDLANQKTGRVQIATVHDVNQLVATNFVKATTVKDQIRTHRVFGLYFLPEFENYLPESIVDFRDVHTVPRELLEQFIRTGKRLIRLQTPYREHLAQHFAVTFSRIALPEPYETVP